MESLSRHRAAHVSAAEMAPDIAHRTWSLMDLNREPTCHAFLVSDGGAQISDDGHGSEIALAGPALVWFPRSGNQRFQLRAGGRGARFSVRTDFIERTIGVSAMGLQLRPILRTTLILHADRIAPSLSELFMAFLALARETRNQQAGAAEMMAASLTLILVHLGRMTTDIAYGTNDEAPSTPAAQRFRQLLELHYHEGLGIDLYADMLGVSRAHLHHATLKAFGQTPLALVHARVIDEARQRLRHTALPIEQIAYGLGFHDPGYFNRFFKRLVGMTPGAFRRQIKSEKPSADTSFAAWP